MSSREVDEPPKSRFEKKLKGGRKGAGPGAGGHQLEEVLINYKPTNTGHYIHHHAMMIVERRVYVMYSYVHKPSTKTGWT